MVKAAYAFAIFLILFVLSMLYGGIAPYYYNGRIESNYFKHNKEFADLMRFLRDKSYTNYWDMTHHEQKLVLNYDKDKHEKDILVPTSKIELTSNEKMLQESLQYYLEKINCTGLSPGATEPGKVFQVIYHDEFSFPRRYILYLLITKSKAKTGFLFSCPSGISLDRLNRCLGKAGLINMGGKIWVWIRQFSL